MRDDEGCQGNPPPASAYFSPRSDQYSIPVSSRTKRAATPRPPAPPPTPAPFAPPWPPSPRPFLRSATPPSPYVPLHVRVTVDRHKPTPSHPFPPPAPRPPLPRRARPVISRFSSLFIFDSLSLFFSPSLPSLLSFSSTAIPTRRPALLIFRCNPVLKVSSILFIYQSRSSLATSG